MKLEITLTTFLLWTGLLVTSTSGAGALRRTQGNSQGNNHNGQCQIIEVYRWLEIPSLNGVVGPIQNPQFADVIAQRSFLCDGPCSCAPTCLASNPPENQVGSVYATAVYYIDARVGRGGYYLDDYGGKKGSILFFSTVKEEDVESGFEASIFAGTEDWGCVTGGNVMIGPPNPRGMGPDTGPNPFKKERIATLTVCGCGNGK